jgi:hypothetical protein
VVFFGLVAAARALEGEGGGGRGGAGRRSALRERPPALVNTLNNFSQISVNVFH